MKNKSTYGLALAIAFQVIVLIGMYALSALPLWIGEEVRVKTIPVDPRSMFRGNYARLRYDFSRVPRRDSDVDETLKRGDIVYLRLKKNSENYYEAEGVTSEPPQGVFIRGRVSITPYGDNIDVKYGIEAFFAPKKKALELEDKLRRGGTAVLMVSKSGRARIKEVF